ncbi:DUF4339 domain-containing protein [Spirosoma taeanense]|uniref:DUF4339 domain-containing protein n=1 Tax=Spirosoma taeanense TaxID=2735870 RepID=A0A6M5YB91_9BACT|nr:DUF4339 domain-containing protein [Spirosoma taeanense]QJW91265.1 DUF4339 domain-containing protein [Spirosoma taeanense]
MNNSLYYVAISEQQTGPFTAEEVRQQQLPGNAMVWKVGMDTWATLDTFIELQPADPASIPPLLRTPHALSLLGNVTKDFNLAALCGMSGAALAYIDQLIDLKLAGFILFSLAQLIFYWGLLHLGRLYGLRGTIRGAKLLMLANLLGWVPLFLGGFIASAAEWVGSLFSAIGTIVAFVDLWPLRTELNRNLVMVVVIGHVAEEFMVKLGISTQSIFRLIEATNVVLLAWLFYEIIAHLAPQPDERQVSSGDKIA